MSNISDHQYFKNEKFSLPDLIKSVEDINKLILFLDYSITNQKNAFKNYNYSNIINNISIENDNIKIILSLDHSLWLLKQKETKDIISNIKHLKLFDLENVYYSSKKEDPVNVSNDFIFNINMIAFKFFVQNPLVGINNPTISLEQFIMVLANMLNMLIDIYIVTKFIGFDNINENSLFENENDNTIIEYINNRLILLSSTYKKFKKMPLFSLSSINTQNIEYLKNTIINLYDFIIKIDNNNNIMNKSKFNTKINDSIDIIKNHSKNFKTFYYYFKKTYIIDFTFISDIQKISIEAVADMKNRFIDDLYSTIHFGVAYRIAFLFQQNIFFYNSNDQFILDYFTEVKNAEKKLRSNIPKDLEQKFKNDFFILSIPNLSKSFAKFPFGGGGGGSGNDDHESVGHNVNNEDVFVTSKLITAMYNSILILYNSKGIDEYMINGKPLTEPYNHVICFQKDFIDNISKIINIYKSEIRKLYDTYAGYINMYPIFYLFNCLSYYENLLIYLQKSHNRISAYMKKYNDKIEEIEGTIHLYNYYETQLNNLQKLPDDEKSKYKDKIKELEKQISQYNKVKQYKNSFGNLQPKKYNDIVIKYIHGLEKMKNKFYSKLLSILQLEMKIIRKSENNDIGNLLFMHEKKNGKYEWVNMDLLKDDSKSQYMSSFSHNRINLSNVSNILRIVNKNKKQIDENRESSITFSNMKPDYLGHLNIFLKSYFDANYIYFNLDDDLISTILDITRTQIKTYFTSYLEHITTNSPKPQNPIFVFSKRRKDEKGSYLVTSFLFKIEQMTEKSYTFHCKLFSNKTYKIDTTFHQKNNNKSNIIIRNNFYTQKYKKEEKQTYKRKLYLQLPIDSWKYHTKEEEETQDGYSEFTIFIKKFKDLATTLMDQMKVEYESKFTDNNKKIHISIIKRNIPLTQIGDESNLSNFDTTSEKPNNLSYFDKLTKLDDHISAIVFINLLYLSFNDSTAYYTLAYEINQERNIIDTFTYNTSEINILRYPNLNGKNQEALEYTGDILSVSEISLFTLFVCNLNPFNKLEKLFWNTFNNLNSKNFFEWLKKELELTKGQKNNVKVLIT
jgi:hypothetical protein